jgi:hypothetical protein
MNLLEYVKLILEKVSFDQKLFEKELLKGLKSLVKTEVRALKKWCYEKFGSVYKSLLNKIFLKSTPNLSL